MPTMGNDLISVIHIRDTDSFTFTDPILFYLCKSVVPADVGTEHSISWQHVDSTSPFSPTHASREHVLLNSATILEISQDLKLIAV